MTRSLTLGRASFAAVAAVCALGTTGCLALVGAEQGAVTITGVVMPTTVGGQGCLNQQPIANGVLDLNSDQGYTAQLQVRTNLPATVTTQDLQQDETQSPSYNDYGNVDANIISFSRVFVALKDGDEPVTPFSITNPLPNPTEGDIQSLPSTLVPRITPVSGVVFNEQTTLGNFAFISIPAITAPEAQQFENGPEAPDINNPFATKRIIANVVLEGVTSGAGTVRSNVFAIPIDTCRGCLVSNPPVCQAEEVLAPANCALFGQDQPLVCVDQ